MTTQTRSGFALVNIILAGGLLAAAGGCSPDVKDLRAEGIEQYRCRQYVESLATLRYALKLAPSDAQANYYMGLNYRALAAKKFRDGDIPAARRELETALVYFNQAIKSWPNYMAAVEAKTEALELRGQYDEALRTAEFVAENNRGGSVEHYVFAGDRYRDHGDLDNALRLYKMALAADPNSASAYASMGRLYVLAGDRAKAMDAFAKAHQLDPNSPEVNEQLARLGQAETDTHTASHERPARE